MRSMARPGESDGSGSAAYRAPEQLAATEDLAQPAKSDVYSLGVVITEMLTGLHPQGHRANPGGYPQ